MVRQIFLTCFPPLSACRHVCRGDTLAVRRGLHQRLSTSCKTVSLLGCQSISKESGLRDPRWHIWDTQEILRAFPTDDLIPLSPVIGSYKPWPQLPGHAGIRCEEVEITSLILSMLQHFHRAWRWKHPHLHYSTYYQVKEFLMEAEKALPHLMGHFRAKIMQCIKILAHLAAEQWC